MPGDRRQILSLLRLPIPPLQPISFFPSTAPIATAVANGENLGRTNFPGSSPDLESLSRSDNSMTRRVPVHQESTRRKLALINDGVIHGWLRPTDRSPGLMSHYPKPANGQANGWVKMNDPKPRLGCTLLATGIPTKVPVL